MRGRDQKWLDELVNEIQITQDQTAKTEKRSLFYTELNVDGASSPSVIRMGLVLGIIDEVDEELSLWKK